MKRVLILKGLPASGKSTFAKELVDKFPGQYKIINKDSLRTMLDNGKWSGDNEKFIINLRNKLILDILADGKTPIVDDTNLHSKHEQVIRELVKGVATVDVEFFDLPLDQCIERDLKRPNSVGEKVIKKMWRQFLQEHQEPPMYIHGVPDAIILDIDGTLSEGCGEHRGPYEYDKVSLDKPNKPIVEIARRYVDDKNFVVIVVSGRDASCIDDTENWLRDNGIFYDEIYMRQIGNTENDAIIKKRIYDENIKGKYNILFVLDDRDRVVDMWRSLGLICLQVNYGDF